LAPINNEPFLTNCLGDTPTDDWYYYNYFSGTIGSNQVSSNLAHPFQVGTGANVRELTYGASGWFHTHTGLSGDINITLSGSTADLDQLNNCNSCVLILYTEHGRVHQI